MTPPDDATPQPDRDPGRRETGDGEQSVIPDGVDNDANRNGIAVTKSATDTHRETAHPARAARSTASARPPAGWRIIAGKELGDNLLSIRFFVLLVILGLAAVAAVSTAATAIKGQATQVSNSPSPFLLLFTASPKQIPSFASLVGFLGPLLGIAFAFDAINNERSGRTLPRLVSQPVHRDDVINGKFVAGLSVVGIVVVLVTLIVAGVGILRLGITPSPEDVARLLVYLVLAVVYIGLWMAFALLCSVVMRRAATSALVAIAVWLILALFGALLAGLLADVIAPVDAANSAASQIHHVQMQHSLSLISPLSLYQEATGALLNPQVRSVGVVLPQQTDQAVAGALPFDQSLLVVWPQIVALVAVCVVVFAVAYVAFIKQEVRA